MHLLRYGTTWRYEVRWDGIESRKVALEMLRARTQAVKPGEWIYTLGGWALEQFADNPKPFTREELDKIAPNHPVFLQASYFEAFLNSKALEVLGIDTASVGGSARTRRSRSPARPRHSDAAGVDRDAAGRATGRLNEAGFRALVGKLPTASDNEIEASTLGMIRELSRSGLTTFGSSGCEADLLKRYRQWADQGRLDVRVFCITAPGGGGNVNELLPRIAQMKLFQGDKFIDHHTYGEGVLGALSDPMFEHRGETRAEDLAQWRRIVTEIAKAGLPLHVHTNFEETIDAFLDQIEIVNKSTRQESALGAGSSEPADGGTARAHEDAWPLRRRASMGGDQRRHQRASVWRCGIRHGAACHDSAQRDHMGPGQRRQPSQSDSAVSYARLGGHREDGRWHEGAEAADQP